MARFHLPVSSIEETVYRVAGEYLLAQYFLHKKNKNIDLDFEGLNDIYKNMHIMNTSIAERIRAASQTDSTLNALVILDLFSHALPLAIGQSLQDIEPFFNDYFAYMENQID